MSKFINIGHGNMIAASRIVAVVSPESQPIKRLVQESKEDGRAIDVTGGRKTRAVIITDSDHVILSSVTTDKITARIAGEETEDDENEQ